MLKPQFQDKVATRANCRSIGDQERDLSCFRQRPGLFCTVNIWTSQYVFNHISKKEENLSKLKYITVQITIQQRSRQLFLKSSMECITILSGT